MEKDITKKVKDISGDLRESMAMSVKVITDKRSKRESLLNAYNEKNVELMRINKEKREILRQLAKEECNGTTDCQTCPFFRVVENVESEGISGRHSDVMIMRCTKNIE